jgi:hypothetical protein
LRDPASESREAAYADGARSARVIRRFRMLIVGSYGVM